MTCYEKNQGRDNELRAYVFANKNVYFLKIDNAIYCYMDLGEIAKIAQTRNIGRIVADEMPNGITKDEAGMRLLDNSEIRTLRDILKTMDYWQGMDDE